MGRRILHTLYSQLSDQQGLCPKPAAATTTRQEVLSLAPLRVTQVSLRTPRQMTDLVEHAAAGGDWVTGAAAAIQVVRFEDGQLFLRDGHHRCVACLAAGRAALAPAEYNLEEWQYEQWAAPNFATGFITPYDPRYEIRVADLTPHRDAVAAARRQGGDAAAAAYILRHRGDYLFPGGRAGFDTVADLHAAWERDSREDVQRWVEDSADWHTAVPGVDPDRLTQAAAAATASTSGAAETVGTHFPTGFSPCPPVPATATVDATALAMAGVQQSRYAEIFQREGYLVIRGLLDAAQVAAATDRLVDIIDSWPANAATHDEAASFPTTVPLVDIDPSVLSGAVATPHARELAVRRLFRLAARDRHFAALARSQRFTSFLRACWGTADIKALQTMALLKPPGTGEKFFHADQGYFRLSPSQVAAFWVALDPCDPTNGAMHVVPKSHRGGTPAHTPMVSARDPPAALAAAVAVSLQPGDALLFDGDLLHGTPPNASQRRRRALQFHYAASHCRPSDGRGAAAGQRVVPSPNTPWRQGADGPASNDAEDHKRRDDDDDDGRGFDCAPSQEGAEVCYEPQFWQFRKAEMVACGADHGGRCI